MLAEIRQAGYEGTEFGPPGFLSEDQTELTDILERHRLALISAYCAIDLHSVDVVPAEVDRVRRIARLPAAAGVMLATTS